MHFWTIVAALMFPGAASAQYINPRSMGRQTASLTSNQATQRESAMASAFLASNPVAQRVGTQAFLIESAGGVSGSLLGFGLVYLAASDCGEDLSCTLQQAFGAVALGTVASAGGAYLAGRLAETQPSGVGALLGAVAGAAGGIGLWHLITEELNLVVSDEAAVLSYTITQGMVTALGSRLAR
jgi:hypothetical protein